jgi:hypothetical protein
MQTLVVIAACPQALPRPTWHKQNETREIYGFKLAYRNPNDDAIRPQIVERDCIGFYWIDEPTAQAPICEICSEQICLIALFPLFSPAQILAEYREQGLEALLKLASKVYNIHPKEQVFQLPVAV